MKRSFLALLLLVASTASVATTTTLSSGGDLNLAIINATEGDTIELNSGDYNVVTSFGVPGAFGLTKRLTILGMGASPAAVRLHASATATGDFSFYVQRLGNSVANPSGSTIQNLTIDTGPGGIRIDDYQNAGARFTDITLKDLVISTAVNAGGGTGMGVLVKNSDRIVMDNVMVTSRQAGFELLNATDSLIMNSTVTNAVATNAPALAVLGGTHNTIVNNTFGTTPNGGSAYAFSAGGVVFYNTTANRYENNSLQLFHDDGLDFTSIDLTGILSGSQATQRSTDNYAGKNTVTSTGFVDGLAGGTDIWSNCGSNNTWIFGNDASGSPEGGVSVWASSSNMVLGNKTHGLGTVGIFVTGGNETTGPCTVAGGAYATKPLYSYVRNNAAYFNRTEQMIVRSADSNDISFNFSSPDNGFGGLAQPPADPTNGQSGLTFETDARFTTSTGFRIVGNTSVDNKRGIWNYDNKHDGDITLYLNRVFNQTWDAITTAPSTLNIDGGPTIGGNYWSGFAASGNPSTTTPYSGVFDNTSNNTGLVVDRFPYQSEDLGRGSTVLVFEPFAGSVAAGTRRTVRWYAPGCVYVDLTLDGASLGMTNVPNTGYAIVTIPATTGTHHVSVSCKNSGGTLIGVAANSPAFTVTSSSLQLVAPGRDEVADAGSQIWVAWKKAASIASVDVQLSVDGGTTWSTLATAVTTTFARVALPAGAGSSKAVMRVVATGGFEDRTDGVFALRGTGIGFTNVPGGRIFTPGHLERLEWVSPPGSRVVDIYADGLPIATGLPDRGFFDWMPDDIGTIADLLISFRQSDGTTQISQTMSIVTDIPRVGGISTRSQVLTGNNVMIAGFIIGGSTPKTVVIRARGPTLGVAGALANPTLTLVPAGGGATTTNDDWGTAANAAALADSGFAPGNPKESAIMTTLAPGAYTAVVSGVGNTTGVAIVEVYEMGHPEVPILGISTRAYVQTGGNVMIAGFAISGASNKVVVVRARGPSLGVAGALANPTLTIVPVSGGANITNDDWQTDVNAGLLGSYAPGDPHESALYRSLPPGAYTAIVSGVGNTTGIGIVEVYEP